MDDKIKRLTSIKVIGWTSLIIFGTLTLWLMFQLAGAIIFDHEIDRLTTQPDDFSDVETDMRAAAIQLRAIFTVTIGLTVLPLIGSFGLIRLRHWGLILYQASTLVVIMVLLAVLGYYVNDVLTNMSERYNHAMDAGMSYNFVVAQYYEIITYGAFLLLYSWMLTRANIFLGKRESRAEFH